ncbi:hypothetical protein M8C21_003366, partial [Ambrosia artemisiifolia]
MDASSMPSYLSEKCYEGTLQRMSFNVKVRHTILVINNDNLGCNQAPRRMKLAIFCCHRRIGR